VTCELSPGVVLGGKIRLVERIGRGGMGDVWVARNEATHAELAVKTLHFSERTTTADERFRREARLAATISHRHVVRVFDLIDEANGTLGLVMELLRGGTLEQTLAERGTLPAVQAVAVATAILSALAYVHSKGIIHRDVKPGNIFFAVDPDGHVIPKILDFGIAKLPAAGSTLTVDGNVLGTPHYMSPEQIRGNDKLDGRSDMFSMAVVLYEMLTGERVFRRDLAQSSLAAVLEHEVDPDPQIDPRLWLVISRALSKRAYERFGSCNEFASALKGAVEKSDEELAGSLQELQPKISVAPLPVSSSPSSVVVASTVVPKPSGIGRPALVAIGAIVAAAVVPVVLSRARPTPTPASSATLSTATATAAASVATAVPGEPAFVPVILAPPPSPPPSASPSPSVEPAAETASPSATARKPTTAPKKPASPKPAAPVATKPDF
jgi:serine/threonine-protein kinase